jgi:Flp pilus assembly protein TadG
MGAFIASKARRLQMSIIAKAESLLRDRRATTAVEFAVLAPMFLGVSLAVLEVGLYETYTAGLSYATQKAARQILLGNVANGANSNGAPVNLTTFVNDYLCPSLPPFMACGSVVVNSQVMNVESTPQGASAWWTLMNAGQTWLAPVPMNNTQTNFCIGSSGSTVALEVYYAMPFWALPLWNTPTTAFKGSTVIWISSTAAFRNEPFSTGYAGC